MTKEEFWWLLWGIILAFSLQVLYDGLGIYFNQFVKFWGGLIIEGFLGILLIWLSRFRVNQNKLNNDMAP
jgi:hypothetical protein